MYVKINELSKYYGEGENRIRVLNNISHEIKKGDICVIVGPSGSGKSTLLNIIGGLDNADSGSVYIDQNDITKYNDLELSEFRREYLGFIFQFYNLIPNLTLKENIQVCQFLSNKTLDIDELIEMLGLTKHIHKFPFQLSGGQQQRCSIARALIKNPSLLLCDEPTGALDYLSSKELLVLLERINKEFNTTIIIVTHNNAIKGMANKIIEIKDGKSIQYENSSIIAADLIEW